MYTYVAPILRTYHSTSQYQQDARLMAAYGYHVMNIEQRRDVDGLALTLLLIFGLLLTPVCVGIVILCFLPFAFSTYYNVSYVFQPLAAPYGQLLMPVLPQGRPSVPLGSMPPGSQATPPQQAPERAAFTTRFREGLSATAQYWASRSQAQRVLIVVLSVAIIVLAFGGLSAFYAVLSGGAFGAP